MPVVGSVFNSAAHSGARRPPRPEMWGSERRAEVARRRPCPARPTHWPQDRRATRCRTKTGRQRGRANTIVLGSQEAAPQPAATARCRHPRRLQRPGPVPSIFISPQAGSPLRSLLCCAALGRAGLYLRVCEAPAARDGPSDYPMQAWVGADVWAVSCGGLRRQSGAPAPPLASTVDSGRCCSTSPLL